MPAPGQGAAEAGSRRARPGTGQEPAEGTVNARGAKRDSSTKPGPAMNGTLSDACGVLRRDAARRSPRPPAGLRARHDHRHPRIPRRLPPGPARPVRRPPRHRPPARPRQRCWSRRRACPRRPWRTERSGVAALRPALRDLRGPLDRPALALGALWLGIVTYALIDIDTGTALYQPLTIIDLVKHAALTRAIVEHGLPPMDPFVARPEPASYYYFFYTLTALVDLGRRPLRRRAHRLRGAGRLDRDRAPRPAGPAAGRHGARAGTPSRGRVRAGRCSCSCRRAVSTSCWSSRTGPERGFWIPIPEWLNEQVVNWPTSLVWVPHHVAAALAGWLGLLVLAERRRPGATASAGRRPPRSPRRVSPSLPARASRSGSASGWRPQRPGSGSRCSGSSAAGALWPGSRRPDLLGTVLAAPYLLGLLANRAGYGRHDPVSRSGAFGPLEGRSTTSPASSLLRMLLLPVNYYFALGVFAAGALLFWRRRPAPGGPCPRGRPAPDALRGRVSLLLGAFLRSAILNNDLGCPRRSPGAGLGPGLDRRRP